MKPEQFALLGITTIPYDYKRMVSYMSWDCPPLNVKYSLQKLDEKEAIQKLQEKLNLF